MILEYRTMMVAFMVLSYNEEKTIERTLNSIKYQIETYGKGQDIQLIIADDFSLDGTREVAQKWIYNNKSFFKIVDVLPTEKNLGTCKNIGRAFRALKTEYFLAIAGDDVLSKQNIFRKMELLEDCDVLLNSILCFKTVDLKVIRSNRRYLDAVIQCCENQRFIRFTSGIGCPIQNGAIYKTSLITPEVLEFMEKFWILDDRTRFYAIFKDRSKKIRVKYDNEPVLLYGENEKSVTSSSGGFISGLGKDLADFYRIQYEDSHNPFVKIYLRYKVFLSKYRKISRLYYLDPYYIVMALKILLNYRTIRRNIEELLSKYADPNEQFLQSL